MNIDVSPDGKTLAFDLLGDLYTVPATGGVATQLTRGVAFHFRPVWSPDGRKIACRQTDGSSYAHPVFARRPEYGDRRFADLSG